MNNKRPQSDLGRAIARRTLDEHGVTGRKVVVSIGLPRPQRLSKHGDWECPFLIEGIGESKVERAGGVDSLQALIMAIEGVRVRLEQSGRNFFWLDPNIGADIPLYVPTTWGKPLVERVRVAIERETVRVWRAQIKKSWNKIRAEETRLRLQGIAPTKLAKMLASQKTTLEKREASLDGLKPGWSRHPPNDQHTKR
jgi:hypothetical protein